MKFVDESKIKVIAGDGGNGCLRTVAMVVTVAVSIWLVT